MNWIKKYWYYWCSALGDKSHPQCDKTSDKVAFIRTFMFLTYFITNCFIITGVIHNLNTQKCIVDEKFTQNHRKS